MNVLPQSFKPLRADQVIPYGGYYMYVDRVLCIACPKPTTFFYHRHTRNANASMVSQTCVVTWD